MNTKQQAFQNILLFLITILLSVLVMISTLSFIKLSEVSMKKTADNSTGNNMPQTTPLQIPPPTSIDVIPPATFPSQILDLINWKLTLPTGSSKEPTEIKQPQLDKFGTDPWFVATPNKNGVRFRAPVNGFTTSGSNYPRSELREMTNNGRLNASWDSISGTHTLVLDEAITALPIKKGQIVAGQIHDGSNDIIVIRLEDKNLYVNADGKNVFTLDSNYIFGKRFLIKFVVKDGQTKVYYNGATTPSYTLVKDYSGAYFKAGAYTQSNCSREDSANCNDGNFGEVIIYGLSVNHQ